MVSLVGSFGRDRPVSAVCKWPCRDSTAGPGTALVTQWGRGQSPGGRCDWMAEPGSDRRSSKRSGRLPVSYCVVRAECRAQRAAQCVVGFNRGCLDVWMDGWMVGGWKGWRGVEAKPTWNCGMSPFCGSSKSSASSVAPKECGTRVIFHRGRRQEHWAFCCNQRAKVNKEKARGNNGTSPWGRLGPSHGWMGKSPSEARDGEG